MVRKKVARKKVRRAKRVKKVREKLSLADGIPRIDDALQDLEAALEYMPGSSIYDLESEIWEAVRQVKAIREDVNNLDWFEEE